MKQTLILNIVVIALLVTLFVSIDRLRSSVRLRLWIVGWLCVLVHFGVLLWHPGQPWPARAADAMGISALMLCGISFLLSVEAQAKAPGRLLAAMALGIPALGYAWCASLGVTKPLTFLLLNLVGHGVGLVLLWFSYRNRIGVVMAGTALVTLSSLWILSRVLLGRAEVGVDLILMELFAMYALLFARDHARRSAGTFTTVIGLICWASVFPLALGIAAWLPHLQVDAEVWNVPKYFVAFGMIVTLLEDEIALATRQRAQYQMLFEQNPLPMWIFEPKTQEMLEVNAAAVGEYGYTREEFLALSPDQLVTREGNSDFATAQPDWSGIENEVRPEPGRLRNGPWRLNKRGGAESIIETSAHDVLFEGRQARLVLAQDVSEQLKLQDQLIHQANHDPLTGLPNRLLLTDRMEVALASAARHGTKAAVLCLDLDRFKQINDTFGHAVGDGCLREVAARLTLRLRTVDTAARVGGEEFIVVLDEIKMCADAERVAADLLFALSVPHLVGGDRISLHASLGIAIYPDDATEPAELWRMADAAMYQAKKAGGNRYHLSTPLHLPDDLLLPDSMRRGL